MSHLTRRRFGQSIVTGVGASALQIRAAAAGRDSRPPNILFICSDEHNARIAAETPNLDRLAARGVTYGNAYCGSPVCVPARASLMTGMFPSDVASYCNSTPFDGRVPTWANRLRDSGYSCWATGKLDLVEGKDYGFEEFHTDHLHSYAPDITSLFRRPLCYRVDKRPQVKGEFKARVRDDDKVVREALEFIKRDLPGRKQPWAMYVGLNLPHPPFVAAEKYRNLASVKNAGLPYIPPGHLERMHLAFRLMRNFYLTTDSIPAEDIISARAAYFALVAELDDYLGRILDAVDPSNTLIVYTSDHGDMLGEHGLWFKNVLLEDAARVPLILAGPGFPPGLKVDTPVTHADLVATILEVAGIGRPSGLRGHSLLSASHPGYAYSESHSEGNCTGSFMIRKGDWKYIYFSWHDSLLFNLKDDPGEFRNLSGKPEYSSIEGELHGILTSLIKPDEITERAFQAQEAMLKKRFAEMGTEKFYQEMESRLGKGQARTLTMKLRTL
jgi:choline-sulfatase